MAEIIGVLTKECILDLLQETSKQSSGLEIKPFDTAALQPTSYDVSITSFIGKDGKISEFEEIEIPSRGFARFCSGEYFSLPNDLIGRLYLRSTFARLGLIPVFLGRVEAGWRGRLVFEIVNFSEEPIYVERGSRLFTLELIRLSVPVQEGYSGKFLGFPNGSSFS